MIDQKIKEIMVMLQDLKERVAALEEKISAPKIKEESASSLQQKQESLMEFYLRHKPKSDTENAFIILAYLEKIRCLPAISSNDILKGFNETKLQTPKNISDKMQMLYKRGLVIRNEGPNKSYLWQVSLSGEKYLEELKNGK